MTLIALAVKTGQPIFVLGDSALSGGSQVLNSQNFPLNAPGHDSFYTPEAVENRSISGVTRKSFVIERHMILWAGSYLAAFSLYRYLSEKRHRLSTRSFPQLVSEHLGGDCAGLSLIISTANEDGSTSNGWINCLEKRYGDVMVIAGGSGVTRFIDEFDRERNPNDIKTTFQQISARVMFLTMKEMTDDAAYYYKFGVGYDISVFDRKGWRSCPFCVSVYGHSENSFGLKKTISNIYHDGQQYVLTTTFENQENWLMEDWVYLPNQNIFSSITAFYIPRFDLPRPANIWELWREASLQNENSLIVPDFSFTLVERHGSDDTGQKTVDYDQIAHFPATIGVAKIGADFLLASRAFARREVEGIYLNRTFVPPPGKTEYYENQGRDQLAGVPLAFDRSLATQQV
jgi:hypothetical protein